MYLFKRHWNCTKISNYIRGTAKPYAETWEGWDEWHEKAKKAHPIRYWIVENGFAKIQKIVFYIPDRIDYFSWKFRCRFITKTHMLKSNLKKGDWHDYDVRLLHCIMDELKNFVERETTIKYINERIVEVMNEDYGVFPGDEQYGKPTPFASRMKELKEIYTWWTEVRPNRADPHVSTGYQDYVHKKYVEKSITDFSEEEIKRMLDEIEAIEKKYFDEDSEMMKKVIDLRSYLWI